MSSTVQLISVLVINDQQAMCKLWQKVIDLQPGMTCPGYVLKGDSVMSSIQELVPDVVLLDMNMPNTDSKQLISEILSYQDDTLIIAYGAHDGAEKAALQAGAVEYMTMPIATDRLTQVIRNVYKTHRR